MITITLESCINSKSSVPITEIGEPSGIAFVMSSASPIALFFVEFTRMISSSAVDAARNPTAEPTLPAPIIDIIEFHLSLYYQDRDLGFVKDTI